jgi:hypothetical protein
MALLSDLSRLQLAACFTHDRISPSKITRVFISSPSLLDSYNSLSKEVVLTRNSVVSNQAPTELGSSLTKEIADQISAADRAGNRTVAFNTNLHSFTRTAARQVVTRAICDTSALSGVNFTLKFNVGRGLHSPKEQVLKTIVLDTVTTLTGSQCEEPAANPGYLLYHVEDCNLSA